MSCGGTTGTSLCDALCIGAASLEAVARSGSWGQSMAVQGDRIYILEQATTQMKITPKRKLAMQKCPSISVALLAVGPAWETLLWEV